MMGQKRKRNPNDDEENSDHNESEDTDQLKTDTENNKSEDVTIVHNDNDMSFIDSDDDDDEEERPTKRRRTASSPVSDPDTKDSHHTSLSPNNSSERDKQEQQDQPDNHQTSSPSPSSSSHNYTVVYMRNLPDISTENSIKLFSTTKFGEVEDAVILPKKRQAFVKFKTTKAAIRAVDESGQHAMQNHRIYTSPSHRQTLDKPKVSRRLYVHFPRSQGTLIPKELIQQCFARYGAVENVVLRLHRSTAIVVFEREADAAQAKAMLDGQAIFNGCIMQVLYYKGTDEEQNNGEEETYSHSHSHSQSHHHHQHRHSNSNSNSSQHRHQHRSHQRQQRRSAPVASPSSYHYPSLPPQPPVPMHSPAAAAGTPPHPHAPGTSQPMMMPVYMPSPQPPPGSMAPMASMPMAGMEEMPPPGCTVPNTVLYVYNLNSQDINAEAIYNVFRGYGIVLRVKLCEQKTMEEKRQEQQRQAEGIKESDEDSHEDNGSDSGRPRRYNAAFIQFLRMEQAASAMHYLNQLKLFGRDMVIRWSKKGRILAKPANNSTDKTFPRTNSGPTSGPPSQGLHISNVPVDWSEEDLQNRFNKYGQVLRLKLLDSVREINNFKVRTALITMDTLENAVDALAQEHRQPVTEDHDLSLNVAFSKKNV